jgi:hypothetical protein
MPPSANPERQEKIGMNITGLERTNKHIGHLPQKNLIQQTIEQVMTDRRTRAIYIEAEGGLGKTHLLEQSPDIIAELFDDVRAPAIIDIYDYANHNTTRIENQLVLSLQAEYAGQPYRLANDQVRRFFDRYDTLYAHYTNDPSTSGSFALTQMFVRCWNAMAAYYPLLIRFDTIEKLFVRATPQGALVGDEVGITSAKLVLEWLEMVLPLLRQTLVIFSGRPIPDNPLVNLLRRLNMLVDDVQVLYPLTDPQDIAAYVQYATEINDPEELAHIQQITEGRPLLLTCYVEQQQQRLPITGEPQNRREFEASLIETILNPTVQPDLSHQSLAYALYMLSYARRGMQRSELHTLFNRLKIEHDPNVIENISLLALVKTIRMREPENPNIERELLFLHDEIYQLIDANNQPDELGLREATLSYLCETSHAYVLSTEGRGITLLHAMSNHLYYELTHDIVRGYNTYADYIDYLLSMRQDRDAVILADTFWSTMTTSVQTEHGETFPYFAALEQHPDLHYEAIMRDEQLRRVKLLSIRDHLNPALELANDLFAQFTNDGILPIQASNNWQDYPAPYLFIDLSITWASIAVQVTPFENPSLEEYLEHLIELLQQPNHTDARLERDAQRFLSEIYSLRGQLSERQQQYESAIASLGEGRDIFLSYRASQRENELLPSSWYSFRLAEMINTLAIAHARIGDFEYALEISKRVLSQHIEGASNYYRALFYNTNAQISMYRNDFEQANKAALAARRAADRADIPRTNGLVRWTMLMIDRRRMNENQQPNPDLSEIFEESIRLLKHEPTTLCSLYNDYARFERDISYLYRLHNENETAQQYDQRALEHLNLAISYLPPNAVIKRLDLLETQASVYNNMGDIEKTKQLLSQIEAQMHLDLPRYRYILCGKIALQRALVAGQEGDYQETMLQLTIALARVMLFALKHRYRESLEYIISSLLQHLPLEELNQFHNNIRAGRIYIAANDLPYQRPAPARWAEAWDISIRFIDETIEQIQLRAALLS